jgi:hypothetical protein
MEDAGSAGEGDSHLQGDGASLPAPVTADDLISDRALEAADEDQFKHKALADRVADLASTAEPPLNIALFGAWGSGKSSIAGFIKENLGHPSRARAVTFAYYDAWKYGGESLRRNFISRAASELELPSDNPANEEFHRGLYQTTRGVRLKDQRLVRMAFIGFGVLAALFVALNLITAVAAGVLSVTTNEDFFGEIGRTLPKALAGTGLAAMAAALATAYVTFAKLDIEESAPSADEEFSERFRKLIDVVRRGPARRLALWGWDRRRPATSAEQPGGPDRIVFFIDELDRCAEEDVVTTLVAIRTFLDEKHCVFIVAADRAVLETALKKAAEQETPTSEDAPYYSTAGAFLDKVFQHQITIPPLRSRRLTRFARDKVLCKGGVWKELRERGSLDDVIYALVPAHIQSPRRIKVLLNNFAINARIAQSREVAWLERASEIAKLTVLQTEYPALADDLHIEPRLPRLLLDTDSTEAQSERAEPLVHRHSLETDDDTDPKRQDAAAFIDEGEKAKRTAMRNQQRRELKRYLERTAEITGPRRDLLYLEAAGEAVDLSDPSLGDAIEDAAPDRPEEVEGLLADADTDDRLAAARLLASMLDDLLPQERTNVMTALTTLTANLGDALSEDVAATVAKSVKAFERHHELAPDHLPGVLEIALRASDADLAQDILAEDDLWLDGARVGRVALRWGQLPEQGQERLAQEVGRVLSEEPSAIGSALAVMTEPQALSLLDAPPVVAAIETAYDNASPQLEAMVESLIDAPFATVEPAPRATQLERTLRPLRPSDGVTYQWLAARRDAIAGALLPEQRYRWVLCMWAAAPHDEWGAWATHLGCRPLLICRTRRTRY